MALFSQDDLGEDNERTSAPDFSGGQQPTDPDEETETPSPADVDETSETPQAAEPDDAAAYGQPADDQQPETDDQPHDPTIDDGGGAAYGEPVSGAPQDSGDASQLPHAPVFHDWSADRAALERQYAQEAAQNVKPSIGRRILAGLSGGAIAFGTRNIPAALSAEQGVLNEPRAQAQARWQRQEQPLKQQLVNDQAQDAAAQRDYQNQRLAANDAALNAQRQQRARDFAAQAEQRNANWQPDDPTKPLGSYHATGNNGRPLHSDGPPTAVQKRPEVVAAQRERDVASRRAEGIAQGLKGDDLNSYALTGKIPNKPNPREPRQPAVGEVELQAATAAFTREHGRPPQTLDEQNQVIQASKGMMDRKNDPSQIVIDGAKRYADSLQRVPEGNKFYPAGSYVPSIVPPEDVAQGDLSKAGPNVKPIPGQVYEDTLQKARDQVRQYGDDVDENWNLVKGGGRTQPASQPSAQQPAPKTFSKSEIPQNVPLPAGNVWVKSPNGVVGHIPQANLQKAIARGYAVPGS